MPARPGALGPQRGDPVLPREDAAAPALWVRAPPAAPPAPAVAASAAAPAGDAQAPAPPRWPPGAGHANGLGSGGGGAPAWRAPPPVSAPSPAAAFGGGLWGAAPAPGSGGAVAADDHWPPSARSGGSGELGTSGRQASAPAGEAPRWPAEMHGEALWGASAGAGAGAANGAGAAGAAGGAGAPGARADGGGHLWPGGAHSLGIAWEAVAGAGAPPASWGSAMPGGPAPGAPPRRSGPSAAAAAGFTGVSEELPPAGAALPGAGSLLGGRMPGAQAAGPGPGSLGAPGGGYAGGSAAAAGFAAFAQPLGGLGGAFAPAGARFAPSIGLGLGRHGLLAPLGSAAGGAAGAGPLAGFRAGDLGAGGKAAAACLACWAAPKDTCCLPCGHVALCGRCAALATRHGGGGCPVCRAPIAKTVLVWAGWRPGLGAAHAGPGTPRGATDRVGALS